MIDSTEIELADTSPAATTPADFQVSPETLDMIARSDAANTTIAYGRDWAKFAAWCAEHGRTPLPATAQTFAEYIRHVTETPTKRGTPPIIHGISTSSWVLSTDAASAALWLVKRATNRAL